MLKIILAIFYFFSYLNLAVANQQISYVDDLDDLDDIQIGSDLLEGRDKDKPWFSELWDKSFSGNIGGSYVAADTGNRHSMFMNLRFENDNDWGKIVLEGNSIATSIEITQEKRSDNVAQNNSLVQERTLTYDYDETKLQESYIDLNLGRYAMISAGSKRIIWGQFEPYSPVDFVLPLYFSRNSVTFSKSLNRVPQKSLTLAIYPTPKISLEGYYFPGLAFDDIVGDNVKNRADIYYKPVKSGASYTFNQESAFTNLPQGDDKKQYAARLMFFPNWATFGFTYFRGWDTNFTTDFQTIEGFNYTGGAGNDFYYLKQNPALIRQEMFGFEFAKQLTKWNLKFEFARARAVEDLGASSYDLERYQTLTGAKKEYIDWVLNNNGGQLYLEGHRDFAALGIDRETERWKLNFVLYYFKVNHEGDSQGVDLEERAYPSDDDGPDGNLFPAMNIARHMGKMKKTDLGLVAGVVGPGMGVSLYLKGEVRESLSWLLSLESIEYFADAIIDGYNDDGTYERKKSTTSGIRFATVYKF